MAPCSTKCCKAKPIWEALPTFVALAILLKTLLMHYQAKQRKAKSNRINATTTTATTTATDTYLHGLLADGTLLVCRLQL